MRQGVNQTKLLEWCKEDPKHRGVVIDTAKIDGWIESNGLISENERVIKQLLPHTFQNFTITTCGRNIKL